MTDLPTKIPEILEAGLRAIDRYGSVPPELVRHVRCLRGDTQAAAAERVWSAPNSWARWERGERPMGPKEFDLYIRKAFPSEFCG